MELVPARPPHPPVEFLTQGFAVGREDGGLLELIDQVKSSFGAVVANFIPARREFPLS